MYDLTTRNETEKSSLQGGAIGVQIPDKTAAMAIPNNTGDPIQMSSGPSETIQMAPQNGANPMAYAISSIHQPVIQRHADPALWCDALMRLIEYEDRHGKLNTLVEYHSLDNDDLVPLNYNIPSIYGEVDVDWMLRMAVIQYPFIIGSIFTPSMSEGFGSLASRGAYVLLKGFWIALDPRTSRWRWESLVEEGNWNSASVIVRWIHGQETLRDIFAPAIPLCAGQTTTTSDTREPTY
jgi:hypothetical protein